MNFLTDRHHQTKDEGSRFEFLPITASIIQGSGIGPVAYILNASDLHPVHQHNMIFKYADDTYLIVPDIFSRTIPQELQHISDWAKHHNLKLNQSKSLEIIISLRTPPTSAATFLTRVDSLTVLGVTFNSKLRFDLHVSNIIDKAARALYGLKTIRNLMVLPENLYIMLLGQL